MKIYPQVQGTIEFDERPLTVTDPGYDADTWCTVHTKIKPGKYTCVSFRGTESYTINGKRHSDTRTWVIGIYLNGKIPTPKEWENPEIIGNIGVDAGLAGFYQDKPDFKDSDWFEFCEPFCRSGRARKHSRIDSYGFTSESGMGDGCYNVCAYRNKDKEIIGLEVHF